MIKEIAIQDFRNIQNLEFKTKSFNIIQGISRSGKTSFLEAIALTAASDDDFYTILKHSVHDDGQPLELRELIQLNFFSHRQDQECFKVKIRFYDTPTRKLEIWKTDEFQTKTLGMAKPSVSPYIFVYESTDLRKLKPRAIQYFQADKYYRNLKKTETKWPTNFIGPDRVFSFVMLAKHLMASVNNSHYQKVLKSLIDHFDYVESIDISVSPRCAIMVKLTDRDRPVPLQVCPTPLIRALTILTFLCTTQKSYFLIDDIEKGLSDSELQWLISQVVYLALVKDVQIFATSQHVAVDKMFETVLKNKDQHCRNLDLGRVRVMEPSKEVIVV